MRAINQFEFYQLGQNIHVLERVNEDDDLSVHRYTLWTAGNWLEYLSSQQLVGLVVSYGPTWKLLTIVRNLVPKDIAQSTPNMQKKIRDLNPMFVYSLKEALREFETVFGAELNVMPSYIVSRKGIYQTDMLIDNAEQVFDDETRNAMPDTAIKDFREAGRCLAFEVPTAAAFHVMRATEGVLRKYYALAKGLPAGTKSPEWAQCINEIKAAGGNPKVTGILDQIRDLHRNPTMHPQDFLSIQDALSLFDVAKSAIVAMAAEIIWLEQAAAAAQAPIPGLTTAAMAQAASSPTT